MADLRPLPLVRDLKATHPNADAYFQFARNTVDGDGEELPGAAEVRRRRRAASTTMKFDDGMRYERERLPEPDGRRPKARRCATPSSAERAASKIPDVPDDTPQREIKKVAVIGAGTMGGGIAMNFLNAGIPVTMLEMKQDALDRGIGHDPQELRVAGQEGQAQAGQVRRSAWRC